MRSLFCSRRLAASPRVASMRGCVVAQGMAGSVSQEPRAFSGRARDSFPGAANGPRFHLPPWAIGLLRKR